MQELDLMGLKCPLPALRTEKALAALPAGSRLSILADDPLSPLDMAHLCNQGGHALVSATPLSGGGWQFVIRRG